jgi:hypothetical protein
MDIITTIFVGILSVSGAVLGLNIWNDVYRKMIRPYLKRMYEHFEKGKKIIKDIPLAVAQQQTAQITQVPGAIISGVPVQPNAPAPAKPQPKVQKNDMMKKLQNLQKNFNVAMKVAEEKISAISKT